MSNLLGSDCFTASESATVPKLADVGTTERPPSPISIQLLALTAPTNDTHAAENLLGNGLLRRGQTGLINGPTGIGKSSLTMQAALCWGVGRDCFGIRPQAPLRILIVQSENDDADLAEMRDGILSLLDFSTVERARALDNVRVLRLFSSGANWLGDLRAEVKQHHTDLLLADPLFAYAGVDIAKDQPGLSHFLRQEVLPFTIKHRLGLIFVHHTNKPPSSTRDRSQWSAGDFAYSGSGHNELANFARFVVVLRSLGSRSVFELRFGKRWKRAGICDQDGTPVDHVLIKHAEQVIAWEPATDSDLRESLNGTNEKAAAAKGPEPTPTKIAKAFFATAKDNAVALEVLARKLKTSEKTLRRRFGPSRILRHGDDMLTLSASMVRLAEDAPALVPFET